MSLLEAKTLSASYGAIRALDEVTLSVADGELVALIGSNGAGKTTLLRTVSGLTPAEQGTITFDGEDITRASPRQIVRLGIAHSPEGRRCFPRMTVQENLLLGAHRRHKEDLREDFERVYGLFPKLQERRQQKAGLMSGGEQQMLAIARALMARPRLLLLDEPSLGIAPKLTERIYGTLTAINGEGVAMLIVEQNAGLALSVAARGYVLASSRLVLSGDSTSLRSNPDVQKAYLGC